MRRLILALALLAGPVWAVPLTAPIVYNSAGKPIQATPVICADTTGAYAACGGTGSGGDATAAHQVEHNTKLDTIITNTTALSTAALQSTINSSITAMSAKLPSSLGIKTAANSLSIAPASDATFAVTGAFWQATQPVSAASLPLPSGAATEASVDGLEASLGAPGATTCPTDTGSCSINAKLSRITELLTVIDGRVDGLEALAATSDTSLNDIEAGIEDTTTPSPIKFDQTDGNNDVDILSLPASENHLGQVGGTVLNPSANFTRPSDTTAYASGDLVANSTTAGSVTCLSFTAARVSSGSFMLRRAKLATSSTSTTNAQFRIHLFRACPSTVTNGDNGAFSVSGVADYVGAFDVTVDRAFTDGAAGLGLPVIGGEQTIKLASGTTIYGLVEARAAYTPTSAGTVTVTFDDLAD